MLLFHPVRVCRGDSTKSQTSASQLRRAGLTPYVRPCKNIGVTLVATCHWRVNFHRETQPAKLI